MSRSAARSPSPTGGTAPPTRTTVPRPTVAAGGEPADRPEVVDDGLEAAGGQPPAGLLVDRLPGGEIRRQIAPGGAAADQPPGGVEEVAQVVDALPGVLGQEAEVRDDELP